MNIILLPQAVKIMLPAIISQCVVALKDTSLGFYIVGARPDPGGQIDLPGVQQPRPTAIVVAGIYVTVNLS